MRVVLYARVSTTDKEQDPQTQLLPLREYAAAQSWQIVAECIDHASANDLRGRTAWRHALDLAAKRKTDIILVWKLDRAFRSVAHMANTVSDLRRWNVGLRSYSEPAVDTTGSSPMGDLLLNLLASFAQFERSLIAERVRAGMARAKKQGLAIGRPRVVNGDWPTVRDRIRRGELTQRGAARLLKISPATLNRLYRGDEP